MKRLLRYYSINSSNKYDTERTPFEDAKESKLLFTNKKKAIKSCQDMVQGWTGTIKDGDYAFVISSPFSDGFSDGMLLYCYSARVYHSDVPA